MTPQGWTVRPPPNRSVSPLKSGSKCSLWQSDPQTIRLISLLRTVGGGGQFGPWHTHGAVKKCRCATWENFTHAWVSRVQAWPTLTPNMARPTQQSSTWARVNGVFLGGSDNTPGLVKQSMRPTLYAVMVYHHQAGLIVTIKTACVGQIITVTIRPLQNNPGRKILSIIV